MAAICFSCNKALSILGNVGRREECSHCGADVHSCRNCEFYDPRSYNECRENSADPVKEKERSNFCDYFALKKDGVAAVDKQAALRAAAEALFKKK